MHADWLSNVLLCHLKVIPRCGLSYLFTFRMIFETILFIIIVIIIVLAVNGPFLGHLMDPDLLVEYHFFMELCLQDKLCLLLSCILI